HARVDREQREGVVVMDVGDARQWRALDDLSQSFGRLAVWNRRPHDLAARLLELVNLAQRRLDVSCVGLGHGLHRDRRRAPDHDAADVHRYRLAPADHLLLVNPGELAARYALDVEEADDGGESEQGDQPPALDVELAVAIERAPSQPLD